jgi:hypothetical protein
MVENLKEKFTLIYPSRQNEHQFRNEGKADVEVKSKLFAVFVFSTSRPRPRPKFPEGPPATTSVSLSTSIVKEINSVVS